eukprot:CAMPEP_0195511690 /NCGR_PEP_ID=MMETSP0794_2-20130614/3923_1 /TAXON_ID=515487 /ORGANISM="Stephanopyxis turris, Strain CCMP 815" /LENGTH=418 /DNA_ID=CAMNT_0040639343 /DNA_START=54 /DNA_END=1310 /DNA_ORIENTATION=+
MTKFLTVALALIVATASATPFSVKPVQNNNDAKSKYVSKMLSNAKPLGRRLDGGDEDEEFEVDLSPYSIQFQKCQYVKQVGDEYNEDTGSILETKKYVIFRLCSSCSSCNYNYGEYLVDMATYLESTVGYLQEVQEDYCGACDELGCDADDDAAAGDDAQKQGQYADLTCDDCYEKCQAIENMEENGYMEATDLLECQQLDIEGDDDSLVLFAGPSCSSSGEHIKISVFTDEECSTPAGSSYDVDDYLGADENGNAIKLSHGLLKQVYTDSCISCLVPAEEDENADDANQNDEEEEVEIQEVCQELYEAAAKCESNGGFESGYQYQNGYSNQADQEKKVCSYMKDIKSGAYDEIGEIVISGLDTVAADVAEMSGGQKFALAFFVIGTIGLAVFAGMLHKKITSGGGADDLSKQGGAMA